MKHILSVFLLVAFGLSFAQEDTRIEFDLRDDFKDERVSALGKQGILVQSFGTKKTDGKLNNEFFSTDLTKISSDIINIPDRADFVDSYYDEANYVNYSLLRGRRDQFTLIIADAKSYTVRSVDFEYDDNSGISKMMGKDGMVYFKSVHNKEDFLVKVDASNGNVKEIPFKIDGFRRNNITLEDYQVFDDLILVFVNAKTNKRKENLYIAELEKSGKQKDFYLITESIEEKLISVTATRFTEKYILTGTYGTGRKDMSNGIFFASVQNKKLNFIEFYNFLDLNNFTNYMRERKEKKIKRKKARAKSRGKELLLNYNIALHPLKETSDGYIFLGEAYYPVYMRYMCGQNQWCTSFEGFQYTHAVMAKFDKTGNMLWDECFEMWADRRPYYVKRFISAEEIDSNYELVFGNNKDLVYKVVDVNTGEVIKEETEELLDTEIASDKVKRSDISLEPWYDKYFVAFGVQKIGNKKVKRKRKVFFVNKIKID